MKQFFISVLSGRGDYLKA